jgi:hypothetical protein
MYGKVHLWTEKECRYFVFPVVTPCEFLDRYNRLIGTYCLHFQGWRLYITFESSYLRTGLHSVTAQKTIDIFPVEESQISYCGGVSSLMDSLLASVCTIKN